MPDQRTDRRRAYRVKLASRKLFSGTLYMSEYHLRVSVKHDDAYKLIKDFITAFKPIEIVCYYENKNKLGFNYEDNIPETHEKCKINIHRDELDEINPHIHTYLKYDKIPTKQKVSEFFKSQPILKVGSVAGYYHKVQKKTTEENIVYTCKGGHLVFKNKDIEEYRIKTELINENKKLSSKEKLYNIYIERFGLKYPSSKFELFEFIDDVYIFTFNKTPLAMTHMACYSRHILKMIHKNIDEKNNHIYELLMLSIYGINNHRELIHDIDREKAIEYNRRELMAYENCDFMDD